MVFIGAAVLMHGTLPFDGDPNSADEQCRARYQALTPEQKVTFSSVYNGTEEAGRLVASWEPDLIVLWSPHGINLSDSIGVFTAERAWGNAMWNDQWESFEVNVELDQTQSNELIQQFKKDGLSTQAVSTFGGSNLPMRWGEVVPLWYIVKNMRGREVKLVIFSKRPSNVVTIDETLVQVGNSLHTFVSGLPKRVAVVISGDLSHVFETDNTNPLYMPAPGSSFVPNQTIALSSQESIAQWVTAASGSTPPLTSPWDPVRALPMLQKFVQMQPSPMSCGQVGFIILQAFLTNIAQKTPLVSTLISIDAPTYYGMMAAVFQPSQQKGS